MGRRERPLDLEAGPLPRFANELRKLRQEAGGPSYRQLARRAGYSATSLSEAAAGEKLPSLEVTLAYVGACNGNQAAWEAAWRELAAALSPPGPSPMGDHSDAVDAPYLGLRSFEARDAPRFFGREQLVAALLRRVAERRFLAVLGASGCGKSSLLRAGLLPAIQRGRLPGSGVWPTVLMTPGEHPLEELAVQLAALLEVGPGMLRADFEADPSNLDLRIRQALARSPSAVDVLLVMDQFEELFTDCDEQERVGFIAALLAAVGGPKSRARVVLGMRADFLDRCAEDTALVDAFQDAQLLIGPMTPGELRAAITEPAVGAGLRVDPALVAAVLADAEGEPGALPMVSHAMLETWRLTHRKNGRRLTVGAYQQTGGVQGAIAQTAERLYGQLDRDQQQVARSIFLRLTTLGEGTHDSKRRIGLDELRAAGASQTTTVLELLAGARLVTLDVDSVELAHEALIRGWPRLRQWLTDNRVELRLHRQLTQAAQDWGALGRDPGSLYRGMRLAAVREWTGQDNHNLNDLELTFLHASIAAEADELSTARRRHRRLRWLTFALALLLVVAIAVSGLAVQQRKSADQQRALAEQEQALAVSRQLAVEAAANGQDVPTAMLLGAEAYETAGSVEARVSLLNTLQQHQAIRAILHHVDTVGSVAFSPDGRTLAAGTNDGTVSVWDVASRMRRWLLTDNVGTVQSVAFSPDGGVLAAGGFDGAVALWDARNGRPLASLRGGTTAVESVAFSPDGGVLAAGGFDGAVVLWDARIGTRLAILRTGGQHRAINQVAFSPDGKLLAAGGDNATVVLWEPARHRKTAVLHAASAVHTVAFAPRADGKLLAWGGQDGMVTMWDVGRRARRATLPKGAKPVSDVTFSPDGATLAVASLDNGVGLWDVRRQVRVATLVGHIDGVNSVRFSPDGTMLASGSRDTTAIIWNRSGLPLVHTDQVEATAFSPNGRLLATGGAGRIVTLWDASQHAPIAVLAGHTKTVRSLAFSPDGRTLASAGEDHLIILWDVASHTRVATLSGHGDTVAAVALSPDGRTLASGSYDKTVRLWNVASLRPVATLSGHGGLVFAVAFSPDGRTLASGSFDKTVRLWDVASRRPVATLPGHIDTVASLAFSPDGRTLASGSYDSTVKLWDVGRQALLATLRGHSAEVNGVAFSPDGRTLASASSDDTVKLWDMGGHGLLATLSGHADSVEAITYSRDGRLASASKDRTAVIWEADPQAALRRTCAIVARDLTSDQWAQFQPGRPYHATCHAPTGLSASRDGAQLLDLAKPKQFPKDLIPAPDDRADPYRAGCSGDATSLDTRNVQLDPATTLGTIELRYSPSCKAGWGRFTATTPTLDTLGPADVRIEVDRPADRATAPWSAPYFGLPVYGGLLRTGAGCVQVRIQIVFEDHRTAHATTTCHRGP